MERYVTILDSQFLPQGLALAESLQRHAGDHVLWVVCLDDRAAETLERMARPNLRTLRTSDVETPELRAVKRSRNVVEYCWTLTPFAPAMVFERDSTARRVTYLDADMFLLRRPAPVFEEFEASGKSVLITEHAYDAELDQSAESGRFCVQFIIFARDASEPVRAWWAERCLEWCYARTEDGRFGDQKYLDDWPERFAEHVHVLCQEDAFLAPWNANRFPYSKAIAWHFHGLRISGGNVRWYAGYTIPNVVQEQVYSPYIATLSRHLSNIGFPIDQGAVGSRTARFLRTVKYAVLNLRTSVRNLRQQRTTRIGST